MTITVDERICEGCGVCVPSCPASAIVMRGRTAGVLAVFCRSCGVCLDSCPAGAFLVRDD